MDDQDTGLVPGTASIQAGYQDIPDTQSDTVSSAGLAAPSSDVTSVQQAADDKRYTRRRLVRTCCMTSCYVALGLYSGIVSAAIPDLQELQRCNVAQLSLALMFKPIGVLCGSLSGAVVSDQHRKHADIVLCCVGVFGGLVNAAIPWSPNLYLIGVLCFLLGLCHGTTNVLCSSATMGEWGEKASTPVNLLHAFFSVGLLLAPATTAPFLSPTIPHGNGSVGADFNTDFWISSNETSTSRVYIPYGMHGGVGALAGLMFLGFYLSGWEYRSATAQTSHTGNFWSRFSITDRFTGIATFALLFIYIGMIARDNGLGLFMVSIGISAPLNMDKQKAAMFYTIYNGCWVASRLLGVVLSKFIRVHWLVFGGLAFTILDNALFVPFGLKSDLLYLLLCCGVSLSSGPFYPSVMAWANEYIVAGGSVVAVIDIGIGCGGFMASWVGGYNLHHFGPMAIIIQVLIGTATTALILIPLQIIFSAKGNRFRQTSLVTEVDSEGADERTPLIKES